MLDAIDTLVRSGRSDLASDLNRITAKIDFDTLDVLRCPGTERIADAILGADDFSSLVSQLGRLARALGVSHCTLHVVGEGPATNFATKVLTTYPDEWITRYVDRRYSFVDPIGPACLASAHSFFWDSLPRSSPCLAAFWQDAAAHGVGPSGCTQPITTERGDTIGISVCSAMDPETFRNHFEGYESDLLSLGIFLSDAFCRLASDDRPDTFNPTDDQLHILRAIAEGASDMELRTRIYQHSSYAHLERSICALFRTRTVAQAAVLAARIGLLAEAPLVKADVFTSPVEAATVVAARPSGASLRRLARIRTPVIDEDSTDEDARVIAPSGFGESRPEPMRG
ncbi:MAG: autoinducer binding domain-containing protein [Amaricoccus sp.]|uniref:autoinducer binding domain-containing protein n=1 Tax=Amaricoccus sp. TaxID=1872485 RepID=UPI0039E427F9